MKKAGIVLDKWKLPIFKKTLDEKGYTYKQYPGPFHDSVTLQVETGDIAKLTPIVKSMNAAAERSGMN